MDEELALVVTASSANVLHRLDGPDESDLEYFGLAPTFHLDVPFGLQTPASPKSGIIANEAVPPICHHHHPHPDQLLPSQNHRFEQQALNSSAHYSSAHQHKLLANKTTYPTHRLLREQSRRRAQARQPNYARRTGPLASSRGVTRALLLCATSSAVLSSAGSTSPNSSDYSSGSDATPPPLPPSVAITAQTTLRSPPQSSTQSSVPHLHHHHYHLHHTYHHHSDHQTSLVSSKASVELAPAELRFARGAAQSERAITPFPVSHSFPTQSLADVAAANRQLVYKQLPGSVFYCANHWLMGQKSSVFKSAGLGGAPVHVLPSNAAQLNSTRGEIIVGGGGLQFSPPGASGLGGCAAGSGSAGNSANGPLAGPLLGSPVNGNISNGGHHQGPGAGLVAGAGHGGVLGAVSASGFAANQMLWRSSKNGPLASLNNNNNNNNKTSTYNEYNEPTGQRPARLDTLLDMPPVTYEVMVKHSWNPDDRSLNIFVKVT